jgi:excisionase family DNA binding protein
MKEYEINTEEMCERLQIKEGTFLSWVRKGVIPYTKNPYGRGYKFSEDDYPEIEFIKNYMIENEKAPLKEAKAMYEKKKGNINKKNTENTSIQTKDNQNEELERFLKEKINEFGLQWIKDAIVERESAQKNLQIYESNESSEDKITKILAKQLEQNDILIKLMLQNISSK